MQAMLDDPTFAGVVETLRREYHARFAESKPEEPQVREHAYHRLQALDELLVAMRSVAQDGTPLRRPKPLIL